MKLRNKRTGEVADFGYLQSDHVAPLVLTTYENDKPKMYKYNSLAELNSEWEDAPEEPEEYWYIDPDANIERTSKDAEYDDEAKQIGNYFETKEEAELAVRKLKAWKRLKDKGFRFEGWDTNYGHHRATFVFDKEAWATETEPDLDLLFGGEE